MGKEIDIQVNPKFKKRFQMGYPLIQKDSLLNQELLVEEGTILNLIDENNNFISKGYYGIQNKGKGWILTRKAKEMIDQAFFHSRLKSAIEKRKQYYYDENNTAFRVFNGEGDGIGGLTIDYYDGYYLIYWYNKGIFQYKTEILNSINDLIEYKGIYQKKRFNYEGEYIKDNDFISGEKGHFPITIKENGVNYLINLNDGPMVGLFLDQREARRALKDKYAQGKTVLNTFSYTGAFSVCAALGGATKTTSVDLANRSLSKTKEQFKVNNIDLELHEIIVEDVFNYFKYAIRKNLKYEIVILDPPSFARSKKHTFSAAKDYASLVKEAIRVTEEYGIIIASTNHSSFDMAKFKGFIDKAFTESGWRYDILEEFSLPEDFRVSEEYKEGNYLKVVFIRKLRDFN